MPSDFPRHSRSCHSHLPCNHLIPLTWASTPVSTPAPHFFISHSLHIPAQILCQFVLVAILPCVFAFAFLSPEPAYLSLTVLPVTCLPARQPVHACKPFSPLNPWNHPAISTVDCSWVLLRTTWQCLVLFNPYKSVKSVLGNWFQPRNSLYAKLS